MLKNCGVELIEARGVLVDPHTVEVGGKRYTADNILSPPARIRSCRTIPGIEHVISSNEALDLPQPAAPHRHRRRRLYRGRVRRHLRRARRRGALSSSAREELLYGFDDDVRVALAQEMRGRGIEIRARTAGRAHREGARDGYSVYTTHRPGDLGRSRHVRDRARPNTQRPRPRRDRRRARRRRRGRRSTNGRAPTCRTSTRSAT